MKTNHIAVFRLFTTLAAAWFAGAAMAQELETKPADPSFAQFNPVKAPPHTNLVLQLGDRLAIIGDSITEQRMYSRLIETYLTVCVPDLKITTRQFGWSGETAEGFLRRMTNDCLRFNPTIATLCYGMNDHKYRAYEEANGLWYSNNCSAIVTSLKRTGARVVLGSPGCVGKIPPWVTAPNASVDAMNLSLCQFRNIDLAIVTREQITFADVFWPMLTSRLTAQTHFPPNYGIAGKDGVHPGWAGHLIMAYAFLSALGLDGDLGTFTVDLADNSATVTTGHHLDSFSNHTLTITSHRYPFCATGKLDTDDSIRSGMTLVPFNAELNRLQLVVKHGEAANYRVTWGGETRTYTAAQLADGVNLAADFAVNPFSEAFNKVDEAVAAKQKYETRQIKDLFHGPEGQADADATAALTEKARQPLADALTKVFVPVTHTLSIQAE